MLQGLLTAFTTVIEWLAKFVVFLLRTLGLWVPATYSLVFVVVCACCGVDMRSVLVFYLIGLVVTVLISLYVTCLRIIKKKSRKYLDKKRKRAASGETAEQVTQEKPEEVTRTAEKKEEKPLFKKPEQEPPFTSQKPLIFRTREDPNILIYEYSDRLVFLRKTLNGLEHVRTERKPRP